MSEVPGVGAEGAGDDHVTSPWAPGGAMSDPERYVTERSEMAPSDAGAETPGQRSPSGGSRSARVVGGVLGVAVVLWVAVSIATSGSNDHAASSAAPSASPPQSTTSGSSSAAVDRPDETPPSGFSSNSSVGVIEWERIVGDRATLPARVVDVRGSDLVGLDDQGTRILASGDGRSWFPNPEIGVTDVGGVSWVVRAGVERRVLMQVTDSGERQAAFADPVTVPRDGFAVSYEIPDDAMEGLPLEVGGGTFARLERRTEIPWRTVLGIGDDIAYRVRVDVDGQTLTFESPGREPSVELDLTMQSGQSTGRAELVDGNGTVVREFDTGGLDRADALRSTTSPTWMRWDGQRFVEIGAPWTNADRVEVIAVGDGALAVPTIDVNDLVGDVFWTSDGTDWQSVELPVPRSARTPVSVHAGHNAVVLSISSGDRTSSWSTTDGTTFQELPEVPGIERSSSGTFGLVAPDPRGNPLVRVSPDGQRWDTVDLSDQLGTDRAQWNLTIDATAIGSTIYVTATKADVRTLLIGTVGNTT